MARNRSEGLRRALTIAGSDPSGGAGIQADLKTFALSGVYGSAAITALTVQNTEGVRRTIPLPPRDVREQIEVVLEDIGADAAKTGMLGDAATVRAVVQALRSRPVAWLVVDPVVAAGSGDALLDASGLDALRDELLPMADLLTPNRREAEILSGIAIADLEDARRAAQRLCEMGARAVLVKGGHVPGPEAVDVLAIGNEVQHLAAPRVAIERTHGTGCVLSAAITARLALGDELEAAVRTAKRLITQALEAAVRVGRGGTPPNVLAWLRSGER